MSKRYHYIFIVILFIVLYIIYKKHIENFDSASSFKPQIVSDLLSPYECNYLIDLSKKYLKRSTVASPNNPMDNLISDDRTSSTAFLPIDDTICTKIRQRVADMLQVPVINVEPLQIVTYGPSQQYKPHYDWFDNQPLGKGKQRSDTFFVYLNNDFIEGETEFPLINMKFKPPVGSAIYWKNINNGNVEKQSLHSGNPVKSGQKWGLNIWIRDGPFS